MDIGALKDIDCSDISVVIVDDIPINTKLLGKLLEPVGFKKVIQYNNSQLALDSIKTDNPDILLLDVMMPGIDGFSFLSSVREDRSMDNIKIIMVSAVSELEEVKRASAMGADDYLTKPINAKLLYSRIASQVSQIMGGGEITNDTEKYHINR